jgi:hypothetical protein
MVGFYTRPYAVRAMMFGLASSAALAQLYISTNALMTRPIETHDVPVSLICASLSQLRFVRVLYSATDRLTASRAAVPRTQKSLV